jgi:hypothetical protein
MSDYKIKVTHGSVYLMLTITNTYNTLNNGEHEVVYIYTYLCNALNDEWGPFNEIIIKTQLPDMSTWPDSNRYLYKRAKQEITKALAKPYPKVMLRSITGNDFKPSSSSKPGSKYTSSMSTFLPYFSSLPSLHADITKRRLIL